MKSDIKSVIMEEMCEKTERADLEKIKEIFSSNSKFLSDVFEVQFVYRKIVGDFGYVNYIDGFANYEAQDNCELDWFYKEYKTRGYDNFKIDSVEKEDNFWNDCIYRVEMHKKYDGYILYVTMILNVMNHKIK